MKKHLFNYSYKFKGIKIQEIDEKKKENYLRAIYENVTPKTDYHNLFFKKKVNSICLENVQKKIFNVVYTKRHVMPDRISCSFLKNKNGLL